MAKNVFEQHIAVFGESGSGKTVLLSSFYGASQEKGFAEQAHFNVVAGSQTQANALRKNYLGMRDAREVPEATQLKSTSYAFALKMAPRVEHPTVSHDTMSIVWHDYPGEWFEKDVKGDEALRRVDAFRALLSSDVAVLLVDAQQLIDNQNQEHAYLKSLFHNYRAGIEALKADILDGQNGLVQFPRIWIVGLSKSDLLPELDVQAFKDLVIGRAGDDLSLLHDTLASMVEGPEALTVGDDFVLLSSAKFTPDQIVLTERVGVDLILPIASVLPYERRMKWIGAAELPAGLGKELLKGTAQIAGVLGSVLAYVTTKVPDKAKPVVLLLSAFLTKERVEQFTQMGTKKLEEIEKAAIAKRNYVAAVLARFRIDLEEGEKAEVLLRSRR